MQNIVKMLLAAILIAFNTCCGAEIVDLAIFNSRLWDKTLVIQEAAEISANQYPNADTIMVCDFTCDYYQPDGAYVSWSDTYEKVLTEKGKRAKQTLALSYNEAYTSWDVLTLEIIRPDGSITALDIAANSKIMIDRSQMSANIYDPADKILQIGLPGVEIGDIIHLTAACNNHKPRYKGIWCTLQSFESTAPIRNFIYEIYEPAELPLQKIEIKDPLPGTVDFSTRQENQRKVYRWQVRNVDQIFAEPAMPAYYTVTQRLLASTETDWRAVSRWYYQLCEPYLATDAAMSEKAAELIANCTDRNEKIQAIFKFVSQDIRYLGIIPEGEDEAPGYQPHFVTQTFANRHGVCRDKAALLVSMLRLAGIEAFPVLINNGPRLDMGVPLPYFNHAITAVLNEDGSYMLMDSTDENTKELFPAYLCDKSYLVARPEGETLQVSPITPAQDNLMLIDTVGEISAGGKLQARVHLSFQGINDNAYRGFFARSNSQERQKYFESLIKSAVPGATLDECIIQPSDMLNTAQPLQVELSFSADDVLIGSGETIMIPMVNMDRLVGMANFVLGNTGLEKRRFPLQTRYACGVKQTLSLELDKALGNCLALPEYDSINDEIISLERSLAINEGKLTGRGSFMLNLTELNPQQYLTLKGHLKTMEYNDRKMTIFTRPDADETADVIFNKIERTYELSDASNWTETTTISKTILSYSGKKDHAEINLNYNEGWETIELLAGKVTTGTKIMEISQDEINRMDAGWVAAAPRYPAGKTLVASLPGVEIGSTLEYQYRRTVKDMPFFAATEIFASQDPVRHKSITIIMPEKLPYRLLLDDNGTLEPDQSDCVGFIRSESRKANGKTTLVFQADELKSIPRENNLPPAHSYQPVVMLSVGNWQEYARQMQEKLETASSSQKQTRNQTLELIKGLKDDTDKVRAIRDFTARNIRKVGPGAGAITTSAVSPADITLKDGYGNTVDNAIVLYTMCRAAGLKPEFFLTGSTDAIEPLRKTELDYSPASLLHTVLVRVRVKDQVFWLNDTDQYDQPGYTSYDDRAALDLGKRRFIELDIDDKLENRSSQQYTLKIAADGTAAIKVSSSIQGGSYGARRKMFGEMIPEMRDRYVQQLVASVSQAAVLSEPLVTAYDNYPGREEFAVTAPKYAVCDENSIYFEIPNSLAVLGLRTDEHKAPYYLNGPIVQELRISVELPAGYEQILLAPENKTWLLPDNAGVLSYQSRRADNGNMEIVQKIDLKAAIIAPENYTRLLEINRQLNHKSREMILIRKEGR